MRRLRWDGRVEGPGDGAVYDNCSVWIGIRKTSDSLHYITGMHALAIFTRKTNVQKGKGHSMPFQRIDSSTAAAALYPLPISSTNKKR